MKIICDKLIVVLMVIFVVGISGCSSGKKGEYRGFVPVSRAEAEAFAEQLVAKYNMGDKKQSYDFATDLDAQLAYIYFFRLHTPGSDPMKEQKKLSDEDRKVVTETIRKANQAFFDMVDQVTLVEIKEEASTFCVVLDCKISKRSNPMQRTISLLKKKDTDEIVVASFM